MMNKQELRRAFSKVQAPDGLFDTVCALEKEQKTRPSAWMIVRRAAAVAAVLAIVLTAIAFGNAEPFFLVRVYANETESVELDREGSTFFVPEYDASTFPTRKDDPSYRPELDSYLFDHNPLWDEERVCIGLWLDDETKDYDALSIFVDGQQIQQAFTGKGFVAYITNDEAEGRLVYVLADDVTRVDIVLSDDDGRKLQHYGMVITPKEGGWEVRLDKIYVTSLGGRVFASWF